MKIRIQIILAALLLAIVINSTHAANIVWTNTAGGNWSATNNWSPNQSPGAGDVALITNDASYTVTLDASLSVGGIVLGTSSGVSTQIFLISGQTLALNGSAAVGASGSFTLSGGGVLGGNVILNGALTCSGGTLSGALTVASNSMLTVSSSGMVLNNLFLTNYGTVNWGSGNVNCNNSPEVYNYGWWNGQADSTLAGGNPGGTTTFNNFGTFRKSGGSGTTTVDSDTIFNTTGTVDVETGTMDIEGGGGGGVLNVAGSATAYFDTRFTFSGGTFFSGAGSVGGYLIGNNAVLSGTLNCSGNTLSGTLTVASNSVVNLGASTVIFDTFYGPGHSGILTNYGTVNWGSGNVNCNSSPEVYNYGWWNGQADSTLAGGNPGGTTTFNNFGTFRKSGGSGTTTVDSDTIFNTTGTVDVETGTMDIEGGGGGGVLNVAGSATAYFDTRFTFSGGTFFSGAGSVGGYLIGNNAVLSGTLNCSGNTLSGTLTVASNSVVNLGASTVIFDTFYGPGHSGILTNYGTVNWGSGNVNCNSSPEVYNYGWWNGQADSTLAGGNPGGTTTFNNFGTFRKSGGSGTTTVDSDTIFNTTGTVDVETGTMDIEGGGGGGVLNVAGSATAYFDTPFTFSGGTFFSGAGSVGGYLIGNNAVLSGTLNCSGNTLSGTLTVASNSVVNLGASTVIFDTFYGPGHSGILTNYGTVNWGSGNVNCNSSPEVYNYGWWNGQADSTLAGGNPGGTTTFNNFGTFRKSGGSGTTTVDSDTIFNTTGTVDVETGTMDIEGGGGGGVLNVAGSATAYFDTRFTFSGGTFFSGAGSVGGYLIGNNAVLSGTLNCSGNTLSGTLTVASNSVVNIGTSGLKVNGSPSPAFLTNYGTVAWNAGTLVGDNSPHIYNYGLWSVLSDNAFNGQQSAGTTTFNNFGTFRKSTATNTTTFGDFLNFINTGTVDVQDGTVSFVINPTLTGGTLKFGISSSNSFGKINFQGGGAPLAGTVRANLKNLFAPGTNNSFAVLTYGSHTGTFTATNLPAGFVWQPVYGSTTFSLNIASVVPAQLAATTVTQDGGIFSFSFGAVPGQIYQIQTTTNLAPANWINLGGTIQATNSSITVSDAINQNPQLFYRAVLQ